MSETKKVRTTRAVYRNGVYYEAGKTLTVGVKETCLGWQDVDAPATPVASAPAAPAAPQEPKTELSLRHHGKRPSERDL